MKKTLSVTTFRKEASQDKKYWRSKTPEERLDALENLRLQSGKFLYEYPARLQRTIEVVRKAQDGNFEVVFIAKQDLIRNRKSTKRLQDKADVEKLG